MQEVNKSFLRERLLHLEGEYPTQYEDHEVNRGAHFWEFLNLISYYKTSLNSYSASLPEESVDKYLFLIYNYSGFSDIVKLLEE